MLNGKYVACNGNLSNINIAWYINQSGAIHTSCCISIGSEEVDISIDLRITLRLMHGNNSNQTFQSLIIIVK